MPGDGSRTENTDYSRCELRELINPESGMIFRNAYSGAPQCTPIRVCLQAGMTAARHRLSVELGGKGIAQYDGKPDWKNFPLIPNGVRKPFPLDMVTW